MITPREGWTPETLVHQPEPSTPFYSRDRRMSGAEAGRLTFGAVFGGTMAFYLARFLARLLMTLLKLGLVVSLIAIVVFIGKMHRPAADHVESHSPVSSVFEKQNNIAVSPDNPFRDEGNYSGWPLAKAEQAHRQFLLEQVQWERDHTAADPINPGGFSADPLHSQAQTEPSSAEKSGPAETEIHSVEGQTQGR